VCIAARSAVSRSSGCKDSLSCLRRLSPDLAASSSFVSCASSLLVVVLQALDSLRDLVMAETEKLQKLKSLLQQIWDMFAEHGTAEYARGEKAAIERILQAAQSEPQDTTETPTPTPTPTPRPQHRRRERLRGRAPSGTAPALV